MHVQHVHGVPLFQEIRILKRQSGHLLGGLTIHGFARGWLVGLYMCYNAQHFLVCGQTLYIGQNSAHPSKVASRIIGSIPL